MLTLVQKVDSLEHELSYIKLKFELNSLNSDLNTFTNEVYAKSIAIQLDIYNRDIDYQLGDVYRQYYEQCVSKKESLSKLIEAQKTLFAVNLIANPYSESEMDILKASYKVINTAYDVLEVALKRLKIVTDGYNRLL